MWRKKDLPHQVIQKLHYWAHEITNGKKSREEISQRMAEVIEELAKEQYEEFINNERNEFLVNLYKEWESDKSRRFESEKAEIERDKKIINKKMESVLALEKKLMESDPKYIAAEKACEQAAKCAGLEKEQEDTDSSNGLIRFYERNIDSGEIGPRRRKQNSSSAEEYTKQQLVRTIGVIWAAALGMKAIGGNADEENDKK